MGSALYPVFEKKLPNFDPSLEMNGKALCRHSELIETACNELGIKTLWEFYNESPEETASHLAEDLSPELAEALDEQTLTWFDPSECIAVIQKLRAHLASRPSDTATAVIKDLDALERVLKRAIQENTRFRLAIDM